MLTKKFFLLKIIGNVCKFDLMTETSSKSEQKNDVREAPFP